MKKWFSARFIVALLLALLLYGFFIIAHEVIIEQENGFDKHAEAFIAGIRTPALTHFFAVFTYIGSTYVLLPAYVICILLFFIAKNKRIAIFTLITGIISIGILTLAKQSFHRNRPINPIVHNVSGYSFPSGHSMSTLVFFATLILAIFSAKNMNKVLRIVLCALLVIVCLMIGFSRTYLRVHYASDVLAGYLLGTCYISLAYYFFYKKAPAVKGEHPSTAREKDVPAETVPDMAK
ncbi:MAG: phosphatase family protein [Chitinophagaceae bacterium]|nr:phosphatase family protein [Chitinophagaceae bacterium]